MFSVIELRLIRHSILNTMENMKERLKVLDSESDDAVEITNDLMIHQNILDKIADREDV